MPDPMLTKNAAPMETMIRSFALILSPRFRLLFFENKKRRYLPRAEVWKALGNSHTTEKYFVKLFSALSMFSPLPQNYAPAIGHFLFHEM
jgi:hypothetical protein